MATCDHHGVTRGFLVVPVLLALAGCAAQDRSPGGPAGETAAPVISTVSAAPGWRPGDRWVYGWTSGTESGLKTLEALEITEINGVTFYRLRDGEREVFWTLDLRWAATTEEGRVAARMRPPQPWFTWPLEVGRTWTHRGAYEDRSGKAEFSDIFSVVAAEAVEVPAGRFKAFKIVRQTERRDSDQYWYAPEVRFYVRWIGRRGDTQFEEQLREHHPAPRLIPGPAPAGPPSTR
jgi:hypothetical protein